MALRILHILDHSVPLHSGYAFRTLYLLKEQRQFGWQTEHLTSSKHYGAHADVEEVEGWRFHRTRVASTMMRRLPLLNQWAVIHDTERRLADVVQQVKPDILHAHSPCLNGIAALRVARRRRLPLVYEMRASWEDAAVDHGSTTEGSLRYRLSRALETYVLKRADAITTICEGLRRDIVARGIAAERVTVIPNGVNPEEFRVIDTPDRELQVQLGLQEAFTLGFIGSFYAYEGLRLLIDALPEILKFEPKTRLLLVGGGPAENALRTQAQQLGIADRVHFTGRVPHSDVPRYYSLIDLLVYPRLSIRLTETVTPLKPLEAMAQGRLLIASDIGGHRELIEDGRTGFLFPPDNVSELTRAVRHVWQNKAQWPALRAAGRRFVETKRTWRASAEGYRRIYERLGGCRGNG